MGPVPEALLFCGSSRDDLREFPKAARAEAGHQLDQVQNGRDPDDWKAMATIGPGVREIRIHEPEGTFRVIYVAKFAEAVFVLHCFEKEDAKDPAHSSRVSAAPLQAAGRGDEAMKIERYDNVWDAICDTPAEAENMRLRSSLMIALKGHIESENLNQAAAAKVFGVTQPRISDLVRGKINLFSLDALINMTATAGMHVELTIAKAA
jgi:predicted XRE-type DNA-binding protein/phage-related protein